MLKLFYDLHIHSCLSPCGDDDMTPANIVNMAKLKELDVIAVTDHNSCKNCPAVVKLAGQQGIIAIPGMELCTLEEVHVLCFFPELKDALGFDRYVYENLIKIKNNEIIFGKQQVCDEYDKITETEPYLLINATKISFDCLDALMQEYHGVYVPAHVDKPANSLLSNLGFVPPGSVFRCSEIMNSENIKELCQKNHYLMDCNVIINSDAHALGLIQEAIHSLKVRERSIKAVVEAISLRDFTIDF